MADYDWEFFIGNFQFTLLHELGHAFLSETNVPALGDEESAADELATITLLLSDNVDRRASGTRRLLAAADGWLLEWGFEQQAGLETPYWDERPLKIQRFYEIVCMIYGSNPQTYANHNWRLRLPYERSWSCVDDYRRAKDNVRRLTAHYQTRTATAATRAGGAQVQVVVEAPTTPRRERIAEALSASEIIEDTVTIFTDLFPIVSSVSIDVYHSAHGGASCHGAGVLFSRTLPIISSSGATTVASSFREREISGITLTIFVSGKNGLNAGSTPTAS